MLIRDLGEFALIERLTARLGPGSADVRVGIGDDAAVIATGGPKDLVFTTDSMVENVHFRLDFASPWQVGWKALASAVSDIGAMGGTPRAAIVSIAARGDVPVEQVAALYDGLAASGERHDTRVVGGDTVRTDGPMVVTVSAVGGCEAGQAVVRSGAQPGDVVVVTGTPGDSGAGLALSAAGKGDDPAFERLVRRHLEPTARLREADILARGGATALIDVSDGLVQDAGHIARLSEVGIEIMLEQIPTSGAVWAAGESLGIDPMGWVLAGGEDYELLAAMPQSAVPAAVDAVCQEGGVPPAVIGCVVEGEGVKVLDGQGRLVPVPKGWDHFSPKA